MLDAAVPPRALSRRAVLVGGLAAAIAAGTGGWRYVTRTAGVGSAGTLTPPEALKAARAGDLLLIDVRRPDEWAATGVAEGAARIDMRRDDFAEALRAAAGDPARPVALICARGVRSRRAAAALAGAGLTRVIDVPEGMLGSAAGPGWLARGLPVVAAPAEQS